MFRLLGTLLCCLMAAAGEVDAAVYTAQLRWSPSPSSGVAGYHVYSRPATGTYGAALDAGLPTPAADGSLSYGVPNLDTATDYDFVVTAYASNGSESGRSNELPFSYTQAACAQLNCNDGNPCTTDSCAAGGVCQHTPAANGTACSDGNLCNGTESCQSGVCTATGTPLNCNDNNPCTADSCNPSTGCQHTPVANGTACSDGNLCNGTEACQAGVCAATGTPLNCDDGDPCTADACTASGSCTHTLIPSCRPCARAADCTSTDACTTNERCVGGRCESDPVVCPAAGACAQATCDPTQGCVTTPYPDGTSCTPSDPCVTNAVCTTGTCAPPPAAALTAAALDVGVLQVTRFTLRTMGKQLRLIAQGRYPWPGALDINGGVTVELRDASSALLYTATVPSAAFRGGPMQLLYAAGGAAPYNGLRRLRLRANHRAVAIKLRASVPPALTGSLPALAAAADSTATAPATTTGSLSWVLRFGTQCVRDTGLTCSQARSGARQCR